MNILFHIAPGGSKHHESSCGLSFNTKWLAVDTKYSEGSSRKLEIKKYRLLN